MIALNYQQKITLAASLIDFGDYIRWRRQERHRRYGGYTLHETAQRVGIGATYLSQIECNNLPPPSEAVIRRLAAELGEDSDALLALAGRLASDVCETIIRRPVLFAELIRNWGDLSDQELTERLNKLRNGQW